MQDEIRTIAAHVPALKEVEVVVTPLSGGLTNRN